MALGMKLVFAFALIFSAVYGALALGDCPSISSVSVTDTSDTADNVDWGCRSSVFDKTPYDGGSAEIHILEQASKKEICTTGSKATVGAFDCNGLTIGTTYIALVQTDPTNKATVTFTKQAYTPADAASRKKNL
eukprot:EC124443.1.p1 GENE.EC124443.1~~EC124443.1.p1  ORF type:complete len:134 (+),score=27.33 EC124443.1:134-535(+)